MQAYKNIKLSTKIVIAMLIGAVLGIVIGEPMTKVGFIGDIWMNCIKMAIVPLILAAIMSGIVSQKDIASLGRISVKILLYYGLTTVFACVVGIAVTTFLKPGTWSSLASLQGQELTGTVETTFADFCLGLFSNNMINSFAQGNILQTLVIAIILGIVILKMKEGPSKDKMIRAVEVFNDFVFSLLNLIMELSPIGVLFLMGAAFGEYGIAVFKSVAALAGTFYLSCLVHIILTYGTVLFISAGINPIKFLKDASPLWCCTIATCSSVASIPVNLRTAKEKFGISENISSFTIPLGSQINADGNIILDACIVLFIAQSIGVNLGIGATVQMVFTATLLSMGGNGIPGSGIVKTMVLVSSCGLPVEIVGIVAAFYRVFDMGTTTNNCLGDLVGTIFVAKSEEKRKAKAAIS